MLSFWGSVHPLLPVFAYRSVCSVLGILALASLLPQFKVTARPGISSLFLQLRNCPDGELGQSEAPFTCQLFRGSAVCCPLLRAVVLYISSALGIHCLRWEDKSSSCYFILIREVFVVVVGMGGHLEYSLSPYDI